MRKRRLKSPFGCMRRNRKIDAIRRTPLSSRTAAIEKDPHSKPSIPCLPHIAAVGRAVQAQKGGLSQIASPSENSWPASLLPLVTDGSVQVFNKPRCNADCPEASRSELRRGVSGDDFGRNPGSCRRIGLGIPGLEIRGEFCLCRRCCPIPTSSRRQR